MGNNNSQPKGIIIRTAELPETLAKLKLKEHDIFNAHNEKVGKIGYAGGFVTGWLTDLIRKPMDDKVNSQIESDPVAAWNTLRNIGATDVSDWHNALKGTESKSVFDNAFTNTLGAVGGTVKNTTQIVANVAKTAENISENLKDLTEIPWVLIGGGVIVAFLLLRK
jgi:hypothetical protein